MAINTNLQFIKSTQRIFIPAPITFVSAPDIYDSSLDFLDEPANHDVATFVFASGFESLDPDPGIVGMTLILVDWKIEWEARGIETEVAVGEGNIVGRVGSVTGASQNVFAPSTNIFPTRSLSTSAALRQTGGSALTAAESLLLTQAAADSALNRRLSEATIFFDDTNNLVHFYDPGTTTDIIAPKPWVGANVPGDAQLGSSS